MCTMLRYKHMIGRNFDYEKSYDENIIIIPKNTYHNKYAIIGICAGGVDYPLLYDGMNEEGLVCGGLAFTNNAKYNEYKYDKGNVPAYDFTLQILSHNKNIKEVRDWLVDVNIWDKQFSDELSNTDLHWFISDGEESIIVEQTTQGLQIYEGDVLTNNPSYNEQIWHYEKDEFIGKVHPFSSYFKKSEWYSRGRETDGLCGGYSSYERFERVSYLLDKLEQSNTPFNEVSETFHLLTSVEQIYGITQIQNKYEYTIYSVVYDVENKRMWIKTYDKLCPTNYMITNELERISIGG